MRVALVYKVSFYDSFFRKRSQPKITVSGSFLSGRGRGNDIHCYAPPQVQLWTKNSGKLKDLCRLDAVHFHSLERMIHALQYSTAYKYYIPLLPCVLSAVSTKPQPRWSEACQDSFSVVRFMYRLASKTS